ncbi:MAG TPA: TIM-barrel domain-containing protein [Bacteroidales bacterium]
MKKCFLACCLLFLCGMASVKGEITNPIANPKAVIINGNVRFTVLTPRVIRMEWDDSKKFTDQASFVVVNRNLPVPAFSKSIKGGKLTIKTEALELTYKLNSGKFTKDNLKVRFLDKKTPVVWNPGVQQKDNLKGTYRTLDRYDGAYFRSNPNDKIPLEDGILSKDGWTLIDESKNLLFDNSDWPWVEERKSQGIQDWYFMAYGKDYKIALKDFTLFAGKVPLPPRYAFGYWWSRYWSYSDSEIRDLMSEFKKFNLPLDVLVIDMDWHETDSLLSTTDEYGERKHWTGWTWNKRLFPNPDKFFQWTKSENLKMTLNLHPASGVAPFESPYEEFAKRMNFDTSKKENVAWDGSNKKYVETLFDVILHPFEKQGVDFWWLDWQSWVNDKKIKDLNNTWWLNYTFFTEKERNSDERPMLYHRWGGLGNHRYQIGFSGDAYITWNTLDYQPYFTNTASNVLYTYWSHDIGGHKFKEDGKKYEYDPEIYVRWMQYGALSPIFRTHSNKDPLLAKEIWNFRGEYYNALYSSIRLRYQLVPYIYTMARKTYDEGIGLCRPMYYDYPSDEKAYQYTKQYFFGDNILVAPIGAPMVNGVSKIKVWLPEGCNWYELNIGTMLSGGQEIEREFTIEEYPVYIKSGSVIPMYGDEVKNLAKNLNKETIGIFPGGNGAFSIYEDNGNDKMYAKEYAYTKVTSVADPANRKQCITIYPREGKYTGMQPKKDYLIKLYGVEMPQKVTVNGIEQKYTSLQNEKEWTYAGKEFAVLIPLQEKDCSAKYEIVVEYDKNQKIEVNDGMVKQFRELAKLIAARKFKYAGAYVVPEATGLCAETALKIMYNPETFYQEIKYFKDNYKQVCEQTKIEE